MADASTGIVVTATALSFGDEVLGDYQAKDGVRILVSGVLAAFVSVGLNKVIPGLGTGLACVLLAGVLLTSGPHIVQKLGLGNP